MGFIDSLFDELLNVHINEIIVVHNYMDIGFFISPIIGCPMSLIENKRDYNKRIEINPKRLFTHFIPTSPNRGLIISYTFGGLEHVVKKEKLKISIKFLRENKDSKEFIKKYNTKIFSAQIMSENAVIVLDYSFFNDTILKKWIKTDPINKLIRDSKIRNMPKNIDFSKKVKIGPYILKMYSDLFDVLESNLNSTDDEKQ